MPNLLSTSLSGMLAFQRAIEMLAVGNCLLAKERQNPALRKNYEHAFELD